MPSLREVRPVDLPLAGGGITGVATGAEVGSPATASASHALDIAKLPPIESITAASDIRAFLAPGVPAELTRAALRRAWAADPTIRDFVGLSENAWDFNAPDSIPGFGPLEMTEELRRRIVQVVGRSLGAEDAKRPAVTENASQERDQERDEINEAPHVAIEAEGKAGADVPERQVPDLIEMTAATREAHDSPSPTGPRRSHGGALPQ